ncbi:MAG: thiamine pyrophosphate-binding protein [Chloroflexota bacterium]
MRVVDQIAFTLKVAGVAHVFGLPGGASLPLIDGLRRCGIDFILVRNESSAVFMAETTARLTGVPGVVLVTLGPGATNAYAGVANASLDRSPVLIFTADFPEEKKMGHTHQVLDLEAIFLPVTKWTTSIEAKTAVETVQHALEIAKNGRPGPVHLRLTGAVGDQVVSGMPSTVGRTHQFEQISPAAIKTAHRILSQAKQPVMVVGLGLEPERPYVEIATLADALGSPVIDLPKSKGAFPADHPLFVGTIGLTQTDPAYELLNEADCILAVGFDPVELVKPWHQPAPLIWISNWKNEDPKIDADAELIGSIVSALTNLVEADVTPSDSWGTDRVTAFRKKQRSRSLPKPRANQMLPQTVLNAMAEALPASTCITTDVGSHKILAALEWPATHPNRYMVSNGLSAMGFGLPSAIAANLVLNEPTVAIHGDGGFQMVMGELGLLTDSGRAVITVILNDSALDLIRAKQLHRDEDPYGTVFVNPNFADVARAYQLDYYLVADHLSCRNALKQAIGNGQPAIIEALIDPVSYPTAVTMGGKP